MQQYYRVAARLGDPDAQQELAFCLLNGKGCKKDKKEAAKWYRAAVRLFPLGESASRVCVFTLAIGCSRRQRRWPGVDI